jgi:Sulfotransferase domain
MVRDHRPKVFGIGLNKSGTSSLHEALTLLGYNSLHHGGLRLPR